MKAAILILVVLAVLPAVLCQEVSTTDFCSGATDCCTQFANCQAGITGAFFDGVFTNDKMCPAPNCPLGFTTSTTTSGYCDRIDQTVVPASVKAFSGLLDCLTSQTSIAKDGAFSYQVRHCIEGINQLKRQCLFNIGLKA